MLKFSVTKLMSQLWLTRKLDIGKKNKKQAHMCLQFSLIPLLPEENIQKVKFWHTDFWSPICDTS